MVKFRSVAWWAAALVTMSGTPGATQTRAPTVNVPVPRVPLSRPPLRPPNVDVGRNAVPSRAPPTPGDPAKSSASAPKKVSRAPAPSGGGGLEGGTGLPAGGGGFATQALIASDLPKGRSQ